ncbi:MAG: UDP-N-acetylmuramoyl-tripeptide--D-alanyl-D-alanine ligase [Nitrospirae bacterium]|nr:UDP-N-acetylmuramoyl-tripeptide--D-alanyl-D-alanine ligase [Nitrospirota bacterium]
MRAFDGGVDHAAELAPAVRLAGGRGTGRGAGFRGRGGASESDVTPDPTSRQEGGLRFTARELARATGGRLCGGSEESVFTGVCTDSREVSKGALFFALGGPRFDGHDYVSAAIAAGAAGAVVRPGFAAGFLAGRGDSVCAAVMLEAADPLDALGALAAFARGRFKGPVFGITGSNGKTTTKELLGLILGRRLAVGRTQGNFNNRIGLPRCILGFTGREDAWVLELGISEKGEMDRLAAVARPDVGVITDLSPAHLQGLESESGVAAEKGRLFAQMNEKGTAVVPHGHPLLTECLGSFDGRVVTYGMDPAADVSAQGIRRDADGILRADVRVGRERDEMAIPGGSRPVLLNALAAVAAAGTTGCDLATAIEAVRAFAPIGGRLNVWRGAWTIVDDTYNANPTSMVAALRFAREELGGEPAVCCLGDMLELGMAADRWHTAVGREAAALGYSWILAVGQLAPRVAEGAKEGRLSPNRVVVCRDTDEAVAVLRRILEPGATLLVKGSRAMAMERIVQALLQTEGFRGGPKG